MMPNFDGFSGDWFHARKQGDFNAKFTKLVRPHGGETRVFERSAGGTVNDGLSKRLVCFDDADTTLQAIANVKGHEHAAALRENSFAREHLRKLPVGDGFDDNGPG